MVVKHGGNILGYHPFLMLVPAKQFAIVLLTNGDSGRASNRSCYIQGLGAPPFRPANNLPAPPRPLSAGNRPRMKAITGGDYGFAASTTGRVFRVPARGRPDGTLPQTLVGAGGRRLGPGDPDVSSPSMRTITSSTRAPGALELPPRRERSRRLAAVWRSVKSRVGSQPPQSKFRPLLATRCYPITFNLNFQLANCRRAASPSRSAHVVRCVRQPPWHNCLRRSRAAPGSVRGCGDGRHSGPDGADPQPSGPSADGQLVALI